MTKLTRPIVAELISILDKLNDGTAQVTELLRFNVSDEWSHFSVHFLHEGLDVISSLMDQINGKIDYINNYSGRIATNEEKIDIEDEEGVLDV